MTNIGSLRDWDGRITAIGGEKDKFHDDCLFPPLGNDEYEH
jgi:hypothetical protein